MKTCNECKRMLADDCFNVDISTKDGLQNWCKECRAVYDQTHHKAHYRAHKEEKKAYEKVYYQKNYLRYTWRNMICRCTNPKQKDYKNWGGRGITVCQRWLDSYEDFAKDIGERPSTEHSIDRIKNDGNYEPGNCKWSTKKEQQNNRRLYKK